MPIASAEALDKITPEAWRLVGLFALSSFALHAPLLWARKRGGGCLAQVESMLFGGVALTLVTLLLPAWVRSTDYPLPLYLVLVFGRALVFPFTLRAGDAGARALLRALGERSEPLATLSAQGTPPSPRRPPLIRAGFHALLVVALATAALTSWRYRGDPARLTLLRLGARSSLHSPRLALGQELCRDRVSLNLRPFWTPTGVPDALRLLGVPVRSRGLEDTGADFRTGVHLLSDLAKAGETRAFWPLLQIAQRRKCPHELRAEALTQLRASASEATQRGLPAGHLVQGRFLELGVFTEPDLAQATRAYERAAELGSAQAMHLLAERHRGLNDPEASRWARRALALAEPDSLLLLETRATLRAVLSRHPELRSGEDAFTRLEFTDPQGNALKGALRYRDLGRRIVVPAGPDDPGLLGPLSGWGGCFSADSALADANIFEFQAVDIRAWEPGLLRIRIPLPGPPRISLKGKVLGPKPLGGTRVGLRGDFWGLNAAGLPEEGWLETSTDATGAFSFSGLPPPSPSGIATTLYSLRVLQTPHDPEPRAYRSIVLTSRSLAAPLGLRAQPVRQVVVLVRDAAGVPLDAKVSLRGKHWGKNSGRTSSRFVDSNASAGALRLRVRAEGYEDHRSVLPPGGERTLTLALKRKPAR